MHITLRHLAAFVAAADHASLTAAADQLNVSQPSVSASIALLEGHYGRRLFTRHPGQGVRLTSFGVQLAKRGRRLLSDALDLDGYGHRETQLGGTLAIGCFKDLAPYYMPRLIQAFQTVEPAVSIRLIECQFDEIGAMLQDGVIDVGLTYDLLVPRKMAKTVLVRQDAHCIFPQGHALEAKSAVTLRQLAQYPLVLVDQEGSWQFILQLFQSHSLQPDIAFKPTSFELQRALVARNFGVALSYTRPAGEVSYDGSRISARPIKDKLPRQSVLLAHAGRAEVTNQAAAFVASSVAAVSNTSPPAGLPVD